MTTSQALPKYLEPLKLAEHTAQLQGFLPIKQLTRLHDLLADTEGTIQVQLRFGKDSERYKYIQGSLKGTLSLICQRCLQKMEYPLEVSVSLSPVLTEESAKRLPNIYEPLFLDQDETIPSSTLVEDEILLNLPLVAKHEASCTPRG